jgi:hypothetical protein
MSGYQISNNVPTYFIPNGQQELGQTQVNFLLDRMNKPTETFISPASTSFTVALTCEQILTGFTTINPIAGGGTVRFPVGSDLFDCIQKRVYAQQGITVNESPFANASGNVLTNPNRSLIRQEFLQLQDGFSLRFALYNNCGGTLTITQAVGDATLIPNNNGGNNTMPTNKVNNMVFTVINANTKTMAVNFEGTSSFN